MTEPDPLPAAMPPALAPARVARGGAGAVVAPHHLATTAGLAVLRAGGSAVDAAIATNAVLSVVMGNACGIGGDAFWLIWDAAADAGHGRLHALNGSGRAAADADPNRLRRAGHATLPLRGAEATVTVPGAVRSWADAHDRFGRLPRTALLAPAIELARGGFPAWDGYAESVEASARIFGDAVGEDAPWFAVHRPRGRPWRPGERVHLPALAGTLERLAEAGFDDFYEGEVAERQTAGLEIAGSPLRQADFRGHTSTWGEPITLDYRGVAVATHPPNSQGLTALELLGTLGRFDPPPADVFAGGAGPDLRWVHLLLEASRLALVDRDAHLTDPAVRSIPVAELLSPAHLQELAARIDPTRATPPAPSRQPMGGGTVYLAAVDRWGNAASLIESNYMGFGSGVLEPVTGIHYQNRGAYFSLDPNHPNVLAPGKRTLHTLLPAMLLREGRPWIVLGSMGGDAQPAILAQVVSGLVDGRLDVATAVTAPRCFAEPPAHFAPPDHVPAEPRFREGLLQGLEGLGHRIIRARPFDGWLGHCHAIELVEGGPATGGTLAAATDPRSHGLPGVW
ncbi:MAG: gamma-glutamyltransferase family protein [Candidatus Limnocylindrales bacterium]